MKNFTLIILRSLSMKVWTQFVSGIGLKVDHQFSGIRNEGQGRSLLAFEANVGTNFSNRISGTFSANKSFALARRAPVHFYTGLGAHSVVGDAVAHGGFQ